MPANTPNYGLPYPLPTEPVAEGAQAIRNLAEAIANGLGIPAARRNLQTLGVPGGTYEYPTLISDGFSFLTGGITVGDIWTAGAQNCFTGFRDGIYQINLDYRVDGPGPANRYVRITLHRGAQFFIASQTGVFSGVTILACSAIARLVPGDVIHAAVYSDAGSDSGIGGSLSVGLLDLWTGAAARPAEEPPPIGEPPPFDPAI